MDLPLHQDNMTTSRFSSTVESKELLQSAESSKTQRMTKGQVPPTMTPDRETSLHRVDLALRQGRFGHLATRKETSTKILLTELKHCPLALITARRLKNHPSRSHLGKSCSTY
jgi:hypothetical protein